jgi:transcription antitermination protein NusB
MHRTSLRKHAFILVFQNEFHTNFNPLVECDLYLTEISELEKLSRKDKDFIIQEVTGTLSNLESIDKQISNTSIGWPIERISKVDLAILRLAIFEIVHQEDIPISVSINEAVELAKEYGGNGESDSHVFINGILAKINKLFEANAI